jgi:hypothetical protein
MLNYFHKKKKKMLNQVPRVTKNCNKKASVSTQNQQDNQIREFRQHKQNNQHNQQDN